MNWISATFRSISKLNPHPFRVSPYDSALYYNTLFPGRTRKAQGHILTKKQGVFQASHSDITFLGKFTFDFSSLLSPALYAQRPDYPVPQSFFTGISYIPGFTLVISESGSLTLGTGSLKLPDIAGSYLLDALNAGTSNTDLGAQIYFDFANPTRWSSWDGSISGDSLTLKVVPVSSAFLLFSTGLVGLAGLRKRLKEK